MRNQHANTKYIFSFTSILYKGEKYEHKLQLMDTNVKDFSAKVKCCRERNSGSLEI